MISLLYDLGSRALIWDRFSFSGLTAFGLSFDRSFSVKVRDRRGSGKELRSEDWRPRRVRNLPEVADAMRPSLSECPFRRAGKEGKESETDDEEHGRFCWYGGWYGWLVWWLVWVLETTNLEVGSR